MKPAEPTSTTPPFEWSGVALWSLLALPGFLLTIAALVLLDSTAMLVLGLVLLALPLLFQVFSTDWTDFG